MSTNWGKDGIIISFGPWQAYNEIHANVCPELLGNGGRWPNGQFTRKNIISQYSNLQVHSVVHSSVRLQRWCPSTLMSKSKPVVKFTAFRVHCRSFSSDPHVKTSPLLRTCRVCRLEKLQLNFRCGGWLGMRRSGAATIYFNMGCESWRPNRNWSERIPMDCLWQNRHSFPKIPP